MIHPRIMIRLRIKNQRYANRDPLIANSLANQVGPSPGIIHA